MKLIFIFFRNFILQNNHKNWFLIKDNHKCGYSFENSSRILFSTSLFLKYMFASDSKYLTKSAFNTKSSEAANNLDKSDKLFNEAKFWKYAKDSFVFIESKMWSFRRFFDRDTDQFVVTRWIKFIFSIILIIHFYSFTHTF